MNRVASAVLVLTISRIVGMVREFAIALAFGFSRLTDLFYQATWPLTALMTIANGPFTTAFAARLARAPAEAKVAHARYYLRRSIAVACSLTGLFWLAAAAASVAGQEDLALMELLLSWAAFSLTITGFFFAVATACGWITLAAVLLFVGNGSFVAGILLLWMLQTPLAAWTLPGLYAFGMLAALPVCRLIWCRLCKTYPTTGVGSLSLPGFGRAFLLAGLETALFLFTQALVIALATAMGEGWVSAAALVQRVVFSVNGLVISPFASLLMLEVVRSSEGAVAAFRKGFLKATIGLIGVAVLLGVAVPALGTSLLKYSLLPQSASLPLLLTLLPAFSLWLLPMGLNVIVCRTLFGLKQERLYTTITIISYAVANLMRLAVFHVGGFGWAIAAGAVVELIATLWLAVRIVVARTLPQDGGRMTKRTDILIFTMAGRSGMGRFASEMARAAARVWPGDATLIAPTMEYEPGLPRRVIFEGPLLQGSRWQRLWRLCSMNLTGAAKVWRNARRGQVFMMIDLFPTVPLSILPLFAARTRGATCVLNMHDFHPHALRYPRWMKGFEHGCYRFAYRRFDLIAAMKPAQVPRLSDEAGVPPDRVVVIEHGAFPVEGIVPPQDDDPIRVLILGSLRENKRVLDSVEAVRLLRAAGRDIRLRIAGAPRREELGYWAECLAALSALQQAEPEAVEVLARYIADDEMPKVLSGVDAMLCPYEGFDSQSGISITAVSNGIPLIASAAARVDGCDPLAEVAGPVTSATIALAIAKLADQPRRQRQAQARMMQGRFEARSLWSAAIETIGTGLGIGSGLKTDKEQ